MTLAELCNTSTSYIGQIEIGNRFPSLAMIEKITEALQIKAYWLFFDELDSGFIEKAPPVKKGSISDPAKDELIKRLTAAIRMVVKRIDT